MSTHSPHAGADRVEHVGSAEPILYDDCERCEEHSRTPLTSLDHRFTAALWAKMIDVEYRGGRYRSEAEARACRELHKLGVWLERHCDIKTTEVGRRMLVRGML